MSDPVFLTRVILRNYKSIGYCDVRLQPLTYLVGANGSGKSNFLDALHLVRDALAGSLDNALNERGGLSEVRRRSSGQPTHFGIPRVRKGGPLMRKLPGMPDSVLHARAYPMLPGPNVGYDIRRTP